MTRAELREYLTALALGLTGACLIIGAEAPCEFSGRFFAIAIGSAALFDLVRRMP